MEKITGRVKQTIHVWCLNEQDFHCEEMFSRSRAVRSFFLHANNESVAYLHVSITTTIASIVAIALVFHGLTTSNVSMVMTRTMMIIFLVVAVVFASSHGHSLLLFFLMLLLLPFAMEDVVVVIVIGGFSFGGGRSTAVAAAPGIHTACESGTVMR